VNRVKIAKDKPRQPAHEIFSIKRRFKKSKEACARGRQRGVPLKVFYYSFFQREISEVRRSI